MQLSLQPMTKETFQVFLQEEIQSYAQSIAKSMLLTEEQALQRSKEQINKLLPDGHLTKHHYLFDVVGEKQVGNVWVFLDQEKKRAFLYNIRLVEEERGKGYGRMTMTLLEEWVKEQGMMHLALHVFSYNTVARNLYESLGFEVASLNMLKTLS
ncbi:GNAT family N-acetyltransferase [Ectobacillus antri]|jgi:RimJ/RimL family protein N-acetyltransferase|uniref:GNAT family N-acetyltransferase n=1 Tax=Ectobacillus antri TaxID=2486280 RepID=A0ABT6H328_9BACI|nr:MULTISPECIES: GNAT family N-acetyltransferase [Ectobacillus]MDG4656330.1 GNAT family N-acetyltransferase [Ectobacillus antri]MDG5753005.1 GNAT family N-acetyltransferase [Ectobacillus antri]UOY92840.1 GNAT family N-acetyltransferase [Ectobacillus sp. JY-23]